MSCRVGVVVLNLQDCPYEGINEQELIISWPKLATGWGSNEMDGTKLYIVFSVVSFHKTAKVQATFCQ
jgi:hypothetical protein